MREIKVNVKTILSNNKNLFSIFKILSSRDTCNSSECIIEGMGGSNFWLKKRHF
jgi:hypothetical protein